MCVVHAWSCVRGKLCGFTDLTSLISDVNAPIEKEVSPHVLRRLIPPMGWVHSFSKESAVLKQYLSSNIPMLVVAFLVLDVEVPEIPLWTCFKLLIFRSKCGSDEKTLSPESQNKT
ncbi:unnamed protein product [Ixodes persulcatus]